MADTKLTEISVVIPVHNEEGNIPPLVERLTTALDKMKLAYEIIFVDDGSTDNSFGLLDKICEKYRHIKIIKLSRNFGHQIAMTAGMNYAKGEAVITMDADLQDPPEVIETLYKEYMAGHDIVFAVRQKRDGETFFKLATAFLFYRIFDRFAKINMPPDTGDFRLLSRKAVGALNRMKEKDRFLRGLSSWIGFKQSKIYYKRDRRGGGKSKYSLFKMFAFAFNGITSFSNFPLRVSLIAGFLCGILSFTYLAVSLIYFILGKTLTGWTSLVALITFFGSLQLFSIGILGEYIGRIFNEVKNRPLYFIEAKRGFDET